MIISASRRTDIPACYADWFFHRVKEGFVLARNPMNFHQVSKIDLIPGAVDGIVFWTKNPIPMLARLNELKEYTYYFQFTVTPYGKDLEPKLPSKNGDILTAFKRLSDQIGPDRVIWRYDPILINAKYSTEYHLQAFKMIAEALRDHTRKVVISFIDEDYRRVRSSRRELALLNVPAEARMGLASTLAEMARAEGLTMESCAEKLDLRPFGIEAGHCVDSKLFEKLLGRPLHALKDKAQRPGCGCASSVDIGMYNTCWNGCGYCYANYNEKAIAGNAAQHNPLSPLISGELGDDDQVTVRREKPCRSGKSKA